MFHCTSCQGGQAVCLWWVLICQICIPEGPLQQAQLGLPCEEITKYYEYFWNDNLKKLLKTPAQANKKAYLDLAGRHVETIHLCYSCIHPLWCCSTRHNRKKSLEGESFLSHHQLPSCFHLWNLSPLWLGLVLMIFETGSWNTKKRTWCCGLISGLFMISTVFLMLKMQCIAMIRECFVSVLSLSRLCSSCCLHTTSA